MRLIYFSPIPADSYAQRPHFLVQALCDQGVETVLWVEPYPTRLPQGSDLRRSRGIYTQGTPLDDRIEILSVPALPIEPLPGGWRLNRHLLWRKVWKRLTAFAAAGPTILGIGKPSALACQALRTLNPVVAFYDAMDNFPEFHHGLSRRSVQYFEEAIAGEADLVLASSTYLAAKFARRGVRVEKVANAYCMASLPEILPSAEPARRAELVLGYIGCLGPWFDWPLVLALAESLPQAQLEIIGPQMAPLPARFPANLRLHSACPQTEGARWTSRFAAGLIPFRLNPLTAGVDPIKYYEYRAAGLPILSTSFGEMALRDAEDGVYFLDQTHDWSGLVARATARRLPAAELDCFRRENDWSRRFGRDSPFAQRIFSPSPSQAA
ncbi:MAG: hypothetical protein JXB10_10945 [Pirellulales bacterium]|nr:hypothetical protein [Pirellulales bacterium]